MISLLIIGNEILSHQVKDINLATMLRELSAAGYQIGEVRIVRDDIGQISRAIAELSRASNFVISSGGVGPTHDDVTFKAYAKAFEVSLVANPILEKKIRNFYGEKIKDSSLRMAMVPENTELVGSADAPWPLIKVANCFVLPGLPEVFLKKFRMLLTYLPPTDVRYKAEVRSLVDEAHFADALANFQAKYPDVELGSYPNWDQRECAARITMKSTDRALLHRCFQDIRSYFENSGGLKDALEPEIFKPV